mgnify:CR=1 FL=1
MIRGKQGCKTKGKVYTVIVKNYERKQLMQIIKGKILEDSTIYTNSWTNYYGLVLNGYKYYKIYYSKD